MTILFKLTMLNLLPPELLGVAVADMPAPPVTLAPFAAVVVGEVAIAVFAVVVVRAAVTAGTPSRAVPPTPNFSNKPATKQHRNKSRF